MAALALSLASAQAAPKSEKQPRGEAQTPPAQTDAITGNVFSETERRLVCDYFGITSCGSANLLTAHKGKPKGAIGSKDKTAMLPPGLAKSGTLPPGLERQYQRNGTLPPGLQKRQLPDELARTLPRRSSQYERVVVGNDVILIAVATGIILDILEGVAAGR